MCDDWMMYRYSIHVIRVVQYPLHSGMQCTCNTLMIDPVPPLRPRASEKKKQTGVKERGNCSMHLLYRLYRRIISYVVVGGLLVCLLGHVDLCDATTTTSFDIETSTHASTLILSPHLTADAVAETEGSGASPQHLEGGFDDVDGVGGAVDAGAQIGDPDGTAESMDDGWDTQPESGGTRTHDYATGTPFGFDLGLDGARTVASLMDANAIEVLDGFVERLATRLGRIGILTLSVSNQTFTVARNDESIHAGIFTLGGHVDDALEHDGVTVKIANLAGG